MPSNYNLMKRNSWINCLDKNGKCPPKVIPKNNVGAPFGSNTNNQGNSLTLAMRYANSIRNSRTGTRIPVRSNPPVNKKLKFELLESEDGKSLYIGIKDNDTVVL